MEKFTLHKTVEELWNECLSFIRDLGVLSSEQYNVWIKPIQAQSFVDNRLDVVVPSSYFMEHLELNYLNIIFPAIKKVFGDEVNLFYNYRIKKDDESTVMTVKTENQSPAVNKGNKKTQDSPFDNRNNNEDELELESQLNPRYNFSNFCVSACNKLARSIGEAIATDPRCKTFNPLFIYGSSGVGKTHLLHAIGIGLKEHTPEARILYVTARLFESQFVFATRTGKQNDFLRFYQNIDCLLIDDIQDLIGKDKTQNAFFHIFNHLHLNNKQIIMSSDCAPADMEGMPERLLTRFKWGMTARLETPDLELRRQILQQKAATQGIDMPDDVLDYIAENVTESIRELEGVMVGLMARITFMGEPLSVELVRSMLADSPAKPKVTLNFDYITQCVSQYYNVEPDSLFVKDRRREIADARQMIMYMAKKHTGMKFKAIGTRLARNYSTVMHACKTIHERSAIDKKLRRQIDDIERLLQVSL